jgi:RNA polymerase sigma factor (sigma-70 family)
MPSQSLRNLVRRLPALLAGREMRGTSDGELLGRFAVARDEEACATLVHRHAGMVLGVCGRLLRHRQDAEDACQATFLVLARRAGAIRRQDSLPAWLHGVAYRVSLRLRASAARASARRTAAAEPTGPDVLASVSWQEAMQLLDEELDRLPQHYRAPLVLCYLEGKTQDEAARELGWALGALRGRLQRARALLRERLTRRGVTLPAALFGVGLGSCAVPAALTVSAVQAAGPFAAGLATAGGVVPSRVAALTEGVLQAMLLTKLKTAAAILLTVAALVGFAAAATYPTRAGKPPAPTAKATPPAEKVALGKTGKPRTAAEADPDSDGDGLSDFHEVHKYRMDPSKKDTAGRGVSDGDWQQRREFTYSVRAVIRVMPPYNLAALNDDYQDVRVRKETREFVELEVVLYPSNTNARAIKGNPNWKKDYAGMKEYLAPGITTNWDDSMRKDLLRELAKDGIDPDRLTDKEVVEQVSRWLFKRSRSRPMFCTFYVGFRDGKPEVLPGLEKAFQRDQGDPRWTVQEQLDHELFGKEMFARKTHGTCTSTAVYQTTVLRALGIPTRMILCIPLADGSDPAQVKLLNEGLTNHQVRWNACLGALSGGSGFASHTFCEVFVGGRWRRLNHTTLGQNILQRNYLGLMVHVHTFKDLSEANLAATWGTRYALGQRDTVFPYSNPYRLLEVSDHFGKYAREPNPPADRELRRVTIDRAYWPHAKDAPAEVRAMVNKMARAEMQVGLPARVGDNRFFVHCTEWLEDAGDYLQYKLFMWGADRRLVLRAKGRPDVPCEVSMNFYTHRSKSLCELEVVIPAAEYARMAAGVAYTLHPVNGNKGYEWRVREGLTLTRP